MVVERVGELDVLEPVSWFDINDTTSLVICAWSTLEVD